MLINLKSLSPVLVKISNMRVPICNCFHARRANRVKITFFRESTPFMHSFEGKLSTQRHEILSRKTRDLEAAHGEDFLIIACTVLIQCQGVTDGPMDRQMDA